MVCLAVYAAAAVFAAAVGIGHRRCAAPGAGHSSLGSGSSGCGIPGILTGLQNGSLDFLTHVIVLLIFEALHGGVAQRGVEDTAAGSHASAF